MTAEQGTQDFVIPDAIRTLLEQRTRYMEWLSKLDGLDGDFRPEVADRVRQDYRDRLTGVEAQLLGHREELETTLASRREQLARLEQRHDACTAELEEAELRHQVGEYGEEEWKERKASHESDLEAVTDSLAIEREAVSELSAVLLQVTASSEAAATRHVEPGAWTEPVSEGPREPEHATFVEAEATPTGEVETETAQQDAPDVGDGGEDAYEVAEQVLGDLTAGLSEETGDSGQVAEVEVIEPTVVEISEQEKVFHEDTDSSSGDEFLDELEFLESLSLDDPDSFDAVSRMLEEEGDKPQSEDSDKGGAG